MGNNDDDELTKKALEEEQEIDILEGVKEPDATELQDEVEDDEDTLNSNQYFEEELALAQRVVAG